MNLRTRIAAAAAIAVAGVAVSVALIGYASTRSHLVGELKQELWARARPVLQPHNGRPGRGVLSGKSPFGERGGLGPPPRQPFGGAPGYLQIVRPNGAVFVPLGETAKLPASARVVEIAKRARGSFFTATTVNGTHLEVLTVGDPYDHWAIQLALPLASVDSVLNGLLVPYGLLIGGGVLVAGLIGLAISRTALAPIERFLRRTADVTSELDRPRRLEETGASELRRLAANFNQTLDALERSIEAQRNLVADASHELRTPIAALRSDIQIFLESDRLPVGEREALQESILAELDELTQVVANVIELARGSAPGFHREPLELDSIVREAVDRTRRRAPRMTFELDLEPTIIEGAPDTVAKAINNLIDNARKWSPAEGPVEVGLHKGTLTVRDHGPGFGEREVPHVFDRFYRSPDSRRLPGSGLGLAIVKQAARDHGGDVTAGNAPGGGALLTVSFGSSIDLPPATASAYIQGKTGTDRCPQ
jgi:two-component system sensor histidine kinase MprB